MLTDPQGKPIVLITGATAGFGEAMAHLLSAHGYALILTGRRQDRLTALSYELGKQGCPHVTLCFDLRDRAATIKAIESLPPAWQAIDVLVNNAGLSQGLSSIHEGEFDDWDSMLDTNVRGLLHVTRLVSPGMVQRQRGQIINISSTAGRDAYAGGNVYIASKHAIEGLTKSMRADLAPHGIRVGSISPGMADTEFSLVRFKGDAERARKVYEHMRPLLAHDIAEVLLFMITRPEHVNIGDVLLMPTDQASASHVVRREASKD